MKYNSKCCIKQFLFILAFLFSVFFGPKVKANPGSRKFGVVSSPNNLSPIRPLALPPRKTPDKCQQTLDLVAASRSTGEESESDIELDRSPFQDSRSSEQRNTAPVLEPALEPLQRHPDLAEVVAVNSIHEATSGGIDKQTVFISCSAFLAGLVEVFCHARYGCFVNMMTGNTIKLASSLAKCQWKDCLAGVVLIGSYMLGVGWMSRVQSINKHMTSNSAGTWSMVAPIVALIFTAADCLSRLCSSHGMIALLKFLQAPLLAVGFGLVNSASSHATGGTVLFAMTGHFAKVATSLQEGRMPSVWDAATCKASNVVCSFMGGAFLSTLYNQHSSRLGSIQRSLPPFCTSIGVLYALLFLWFEEPFANRIQYLLSLTPKASAKWHRECLGKASSLPCRMDVIYCEGSPMAKASPSLDS